MSLLESYSPELTEEQKFGKWYNSIELLEFMNDNFQDLVKKTPIEIIKDFKEFAKKSAEESIACVK